MFKNENKSSNVLTGKNIYIPPQLRNDLSLKELFTKRNKYNLYHHKKIKKDKNISTNYSKTNILNNVDKYISVNKSNYNLLSSKKHEKIFLNTITPEINLGTISNHNSSSINKNKKALNLKSYIEKELTQRKTDKLVNKIIKKIQHSNPGKKMPFYSNFSSPISKYSKNKLKKNKLILK